MVMDCQFGVSSVNYAKPSFIAPVSGVYYGDGLSVWRFISKLL